MEVNFKLPSCPRWKKYIERHMTKPYFKKIVKELEQQKNSEYFIEENISIFPPDDLVFAAFDTCHWKNIKVVILGQDPYTNPGQAMGLSFSVPKGTKIPPSLRNIYKELATDVGCKDINHGDLTSWSNQGVLLLNTSLTVRQKKSNSHSKLWARFTDNVIKYISDKKKSVVFMLWGNNAKKKLSLIDTSKHTVLTAVHPSPLSASKGWFGSKQFSICNAALENAGKTPIDWSPDYPDRPDNVKLTKPTKFKTSKLKLKTKVKPKTKVKARPKAKTVKTKTVKKPKVAPKAKTDKKTKVASKSKVTTKNKKGKGKGKGMAKGQELDVTSQELDVTNLLICVKCNKTVCVDEGMVCDVCGSLVCNQCDRKITYKIACKHCDEPMDIGLCFACTLMGKRLSVIDHTSKHSSGVMGDDGKPNFLATTSLTLYQKLVRET